MKDNAKNFANFFYGKKEITSCELVIFFTLFMVHSLISLKKALQICRAFIFWGVFILKKLRCQKFNYLATGPIIASMVPAATAVPITPATLGPIACMSKKLEGLAF